MKITKNINDDIFREYDIRGIYNKDLTEDSVYTIGLAIGSIIRRKNKNSAVIGYDNRLSSPAVYKALTTGLMDAGINITNLGLVTTTMYYYALYHLKAESGVMITASHNPKEYNGFKISFNGLYNCFGEEIQDIYNVIKKEDFIYGDAKEEKEYDIKEEYINYILSSLKPFNRKLKVVVDPGNGTSSIIAKEVFDKINVDCIIINGQSDPTFPSHPLDTSEEENLIQLKEAVLKNNADLGIAYDGDADRMAILDEKGNMINTDLIMIIFIRDIIGQLPDKRISFDIKCTKALEDEIIKLGGTPIQIRTGNSYTRANVVDQHILFGGEYSGHICFNDRFYGADDGIYASLRMIEILSNTNKKINELLQGINKYYSTDEERIPVINDDIKFIIVEKVKEYVKKKGYKTLTIDGVKALFEDGFALVRASNTTPLISIRFEAKTKDRLKEIEEEFTSLLNKLINNKE